MILIFRIVFDIRYTPRTCKTFASRCAGGSLACYNYANASIAKNAPIMGAALLAGAATFDARSKLVVAVELERERDVIPELVVVVLPPEPPALAEVTGRVATTVTLVALFVVMLPVTLVLGAPVLAVLLSD